jgi:hypothetical protein
MVEPLTAERDHRLVRLAERVHEKYCAVGRALRGGAETIQTLPVSPAAAEA